MTHLKQICLAVQFSNNEHCLGIFSRIFQLRFGIFSTFQQTDCAGPAATLTVVWRCTPSCGELFGMIKTGFVTESIESTPIWFFSLSPQPYTFPEWLTHRTWNAPTETDCIDSGKFTFFGAVTFWSFPWPRRWNWPLKGWFYISPPENSLNPLLQFNPLSARKRIKSKTISILIYSSRI